MVVPTDGRYWRYNYRFDSKQKTLALGIYPDLPLELARARHQAARRLLATGVDPSSQREELRRSSRQPACDSIQFCSLREADLGRARSSLGRGKAM